MTKLFSQQNYVCCDKTFVAAKMILVVAPTNDRSDHTNVDFTRRATSETYKYRFYHTGTEDLKNTNADFTTVYTDRVGLNQMVCTEIVNLKHANQYLI